MDKYEYKLKIEHIKKVAARKDYEAAVQLCDSIDWSRVKDVKMLTLVSDIYTGVGQYEDAISILIQAYQYAPIGRRIVYRLTELAIEAGLYTDAEEYYDEFCQIASGDQGEILLKYKLDKAKGAPDEKLIKILEAYKERDFDERWSYELAKLYAKVNRKDDCIQLCDDIVLWFGMGKYVEKALDLKARYAPLTELQKQKRQSSMQIEAAAKEAEEQETDEYWPKRRMEEPKEDTLSREQSAEVALRLKELAREEKEKKEASMNFTDHDVDSRYIPGEVTIMLDEVARAVAAEITEATEEKAEETESVWAQEEEAAAKVPEEETVVETPEEETAVKASAEEMVADTLEEVAVSAEISEEAVAAEEIPEEETVSEDNAVVSEHADASDKEAIPEETEEAASLAKIIETSTDHVEQMQKEHLKINEQVSELRREFEEGKAASEAMEGDDTPIEISSPEIEDAKAELEKELKRTEAILNEEPSLNLFDTTSDEDFAEKKQKAEAPEFYVEQPEEKASIFMPPQNPKNLSKVWHFAVKEADKAAALKIAIEKIKEMDDGKIARPSTMVKAQGIKLNKKGIISSLDKLLNRIVVVEEAGQMEPRLLDEFEKVMDKNDRGLQVIFMDAPEQIERIFRENQALAQDFSAQFSEESCRLTADELIEYANTYAEEKDYVVDDSASLLLEEMIFELIEDDHDDPKAAVEEIMEQAMANASRKSLGKSIKHLFVLKYDEEGRVLLKENDFLD